MNIAVITGASSGMGRDFVFAIDKEFTLDEIWVIARREERLLELQKDCRAKIRPIALDLAVSESHEIYKGLLEEHKPEIQVLINNAGFGLFGEFSQLDLDKQLNLIDLNVKGLTAMSHISLPYMPAGSHLLNLASNSSWQPVPYINVYGSSKAYVMNFSRALEMELKKRKIHVMAINCDKDTEENCGATLGSSNVLCKNSNAGRENIHTERLAEIHSHKVSKGTILKRLDSLGKGEFLLFGRKINSLLYENSAKNNGNCKKNTKADTNYKIEGS